MQVLLLLLVPLVDWSEDDAVRCSDAVVQMSFFGYIFMHLFRKLAIAVEHELLLELLALKLKRVVVTPLLRNSIFEAFLVSVFSHIVFACLDLMIDCVKEFVFHQNIC